MKLLRGGSNPNPTLNQNLNPSPSPSPNRNPDPNPNQERLHAKHRLEAAAVTAHLNKEKNAMANISPAGEERVLELAVRLRQKIEPEAYF